MSSSFEKANAKLLGSFAGGVNIAAPADGKRLSREERDKILEKEETKVKPVEEVVESPVAVTEPEADKKGPGRPRTDDSLINPCGVNFKIEKDLHKALKIVAAERGLTLKDVFLEGIGLVLEKYGVDLESRFGVKL